MIADEDGIEAAAATMVTMETCAMYEPQEIKEFHANQPFRFMIYTNEDTPELLFYGQIME